MDLPHSYNPGADTPADVKVCTCGRPLIHAIHPHGPIHVRHGRCACGRPVDSVCHIVRKARS